ncbi:MAG TPA: hypothetical protein VJK50_00945, partial [Patescibacteria group bacterium]|nr:hypothetical protein [Patescibacteria group bacterium]
TKFPLASRRWSDHIAASSEVLKKVKLVKKFSIADERWGRLREVTSWATEAASFYEQFVEHVPEEYRYLHCDSFIRAKIGAEGCAANNHPPNALIVLSGGLNIGKVLCTMCERTLLPTQLFNFS